MALFFLSNNNISGNKIYMTFYINPNVFCYSIRNLNIFSVSGDSNSRFDVPFVDV